LIVASDTLEGSVDHLGRALVRLRTPNNFEFLCAIDTGFNRSLLFQRRLAIEAGFLPFAPRILENLRTASTVALQSSKSCAVASSGSAAAGSLTRTLSCMSRPVRSTGLHLCCWELNCSKAPCCRSILPPCASSFASRRTRKLSRRLTFCARESHSPWDRSLYRS
jgi:hypothetical protein